LRPARRKAVGRCGAAGRDQAAAPDREGVDSGDQPPDGVAAQDGSQGAGDAGAAARYSRAARGSKLDPFKDWICEQLQADPRIQSQRLRELATELGSPGGRSIFDDFVREVRPEATEV
jgi:hypothetical protein